MMPRVLVTGASGFVGRALLRHLARERKWPCVATVRRWDKSIAEFSEAVICAELPSVPSDLHAALKKIDVVVHLAARAHVFKENRESALVAFRRDNVSGTLTLARAAAKAGVKRFVFISTIGVNGNASLTPFLETDVPAPSDPYALAKMEAEQGLRELAAEVLMDVVIIRPPLVYGPGAPGNFGRLIHALEKGLVLPLGALDNLRSFVSRDNLVDFIAHCVIHPAAAGEMFLVADGEDIAVTDLLRRVGEFLHKPARLFPVPPQVLMLGATLLGQRAMAERLCATMQVNIDKARNLLGWTPPLSLNQGLALLAQDKNADLHECRYEKKF